MSRHLRHNRLYQCIVVALLMTPAKKRFKEMMEIQEALFDLPTN
jgi:hypothetical protein